MNKVSFRNIVVIALGIVFVCALFQSWDSIVSFLGILCTAVIPLILGFAIAYVVSIPTTFMRRHFFPNSSSRLVNNMRQPVCLAIVIVMFIVGLAFVFSVIIPALVDTVQIVQNHGQKFIEDTIEYPIFEPVRDPVRHFLDSDLFQSLINLDVVGMANTLFGGTMGSLTTQVLSLVSVVMTGFFGILFSFILLTDTTDALQKAKLVLSAYLGPKRTEKAATVVHVIDSSFHSFIVRQFLEGIILGSVGAVVLMITLHDTTYALGVGALMSLCALIPIVGYPVGLVLSAFMVVINDGMAAVLYILCVVIAQLLEAGQIQPRVGDRNTVLPPIWVTVGVTIGGGIAGFLGMLVAIPIASTIYQLIYLNVEKHVAAHEKAELAALESNGAGDAQTEDFAPESDAVPKASHMREAQLTEGLKDDDGDGVGEVE